MVAKVERTVKMHGINDSPTHRHSTKRTPRQIARGKLAEASQRLACGKGQFGIKSFFEWLKSNGTSSL